MTHITPTMLSDIYEETYKSAKVYLYFSRPQLLSLIYLFVGISKFNIMYVRHFPWGTFMSRIFYNAGGMKDFEEIYVC